MKKIDFFSGIPGAKRQRETDTFKQPKFKTFKIQEDVQQWVEIDSDASANTISDASDLEIVQVEQPQDLPTSLIQAPPEIINRRKSVLDRGTDRQPNNIYSKYNTMTSPYASKFKLPQNIKDVRPRGNTKARSTQLFQGYQKISRQNSVVEGPLNGKAFVITGIQPLPREDLAQILRQLGARVTNTVSGKTDILVYGELLENGKHYTQGAKYRKAKELKKEIMSFEALDKWILQLTSKRLVKPAQKPQQQVEQEVQVIQIEENDDPITDLKADFHQPDQKFKIKTKQEIGSQLWVQKYRPYQLQDIVGNMTAIKNLKKWLQDWEKVILLGQYKECNPYKSRTFDTEKNLNAAAALISGPPGIGKTTTVRLLAIMLRYEILEVNASDKRSKREISKLLAQTRNNNSLTKSGGIKRTLILLDEIDGMTPSDRGGIGAAIQFIRKTRVPIICICNDRYHKKLRPLMKYCYEIQFAPPSKFQISKFVSKILQKENFTISPSALERIIDSAGSDIRQILNMLELWSRSHDSISFTQVRQNRFISKKDDSFTLSVFDAVAKIFDSTQFKKLKQKEKIDLFFIDSQLIGLMVQENYLYAFQSTKKVVHDMSRAADSIAFADIMDSKIRRHRQWSLLQYYGQAACVEPAMLSGNKVAFPRFPEYLKTYGTYKKNARLVQELKKSLWCPGAETNAIIGEYAPILYKLIVTPLKMKLQNGVQEAVDTMWQFRIRPDMISEHLIQLQFGYTTFEADYKSVNREVKQKVTRLYNQLYKDSIIKSKKGKQLYKEETEQFDDEEQEQQFESEEEKADELIKPSKIGKLSQRPKKKQSKKNEPKPITAFFGN